MEEIASSVYALIKGGRSIREVIFLIEREVVAKALYDSAGNQQRAAKKLGLNRTTLVMRIKRYKLD